MKLDSLSQSAYSASPVMISELRTAHSGPELIASLPEPHLAHEIARALFADHTELSQNVFQPYSGGHTHSLIRLNRR